MGFKYWIEGVELIALFSILVGMPCFFIAVLGSKMINDLGNFPTRSAQIQKSAGWKILLAELFSFALLVAFFHFFS